MSSLTDGGYNWPVVCMALFLSVLLWLRLYAPRDVPQNALQASVAEPLKDVHFAYGVCEMQGRRAYMEDRHLAAGNLKGNTKHSLYAVFDGHGGSTAAQ